MKKETNYIPSTVPDKPPPPPAPPHPPCMRLRDEKETNESELDRIKYEAFMTGYGYALNGKINNLDSLAGVIVTQFLVFMQNRGIWLYHQFIGEYPQELTDKELFKLKDKFKEMYCTFNKE